MLLRVVVGGEIQPQTKDGKDARTRTENRAKAAERVIEVSFDVAHKRIARNIAAVWLCEGIIALDEACSQRRWVVRPCDADTNTLLDGAGRAMQQMGQRIKIETHLGEALSECGTTIREIAADDEAQSKRKENEACMHSADGARSETRTAVIGDVVEQHARIGFTHARQPELQARVPREGHLMTFGPTGSGKTSCFAIPTVLDHEGSLVIVDPKGDIYDATHEARRERGDRVWRVDPDIGKASDGLNPLDVLRMDKLASEARRIARHVCDPKQGGGGRNNDKFWYDTAQSTLAAAIAHIAADRSAEERSLTTAAWLGDADESVSVQATRIIERISTSKFARRHIAKLHGGDSATSASELGSFGASVRLTYRQQISWLSDEAYSHVLDKTTVDIERIKRGERFSLYLTIAPERLASDGAFLRLLVATLLTIMMRRTHCPATATMFLLDEAGQIGELAEIRVLTTLLRSTGVQLWTMWQSAGQLAALYEDWEHLIENTHTLVRLGEENARPGGENTNNPHGLIAALTATDREIRKGEAAVRQQGLGSRIIRMRPYFEREARKGGGATFNISGEGTEKERGSSESLDAPG